MILRIELIEKQVSCGKKISKVNNLTTKEWEYAVDRSINGQSDSTIKTDIIKQRKK